jgi:hypothetical protein
MLDICKKFIKDDVMIIPFKLIGADQVLPVKFEIKAKLTTHTLKFSPNLIDFGSIFSGQASRRPLMIENFSNLPQEVMFYPLPTSISIEP